MNSKSLDQNPFSFQQTSDNRIFIFWHGKNIIILKGQKALSFLTCISGLDEHKQQLLMAKVTGNLKRGNER